MALLDEDPLENEDGLLDEEELLLLPELNDRVDDDEELRLPPLLKPFASTNGAVRNDMIRTNVRYLRYFI